MLIVKQKLIYMCIYIVKKVTSKGIGASDLFEDAFFVIDAVLIAILCPIPKLYQNRSQSFVVVFCFTPTRFMLIGWKKPLALSASWVHLGKSLLQLVSPDFQLCDSSLQTWQLLSYRRHTKVPVLCSKCLLKLLLIFNLFVHWACIYIVGKAPSVIHVHKGDCQHWCLSNSQYIYLGKGDF